MWGGDAVGDGVAQEGEGGRESVWGGGTQWGMGLRRRETTATANRQSQLCRAYLEREEGAEVNDLPAAEGDHVLAGRLREQPDGFEVHVEDLQG